MAFAIGFFLEGWFIWLSPEGLASPFFTGSRGHVASALQQWHSGLLTYQICNGNTRAFCITNKVAAARDGKSLSRHAEDLLMLPRVQSRRQETKAIPTPLSLQSFSLQSKSFPAKGLFALWREGMGLTGTAQNQTQVAECSWSIKP